MRIGNIVFLLLAALCFANAIELALVREDPADIQQDAQETEAAEGPTETKSTDKVGQAEADLKSTAPVCTVESMLPWKVRRKQLT